MASSTDAKRRKTIVPCCNLDRWVMWLKHDPKGGCDGLVTIVHSLQQPWSDGSLTQVLENLRKNKNLLLMLEHSLILSLDLHGIDEVVASMHVRKLTKFFVVWFPRNRVALEELYRSGILNRSVIRLCRHRVMECRESSSDFASLLKFYLDGELVDCKSFFGNVENVLRMQGIAAVFSETCMEAGQIELLVMFLTLVRDCDFGSHQSTMMTIFKTHMDVARTRIYGFIEKLVVPASRAWFEQQMSFAVGHTAIGFDHKLKARAYCLVVTKLAEELNRERYQLPSMKRIVLEAVLGEHERDATRRHYFMREILGDGLRDRRVQTPFEQAIGVTCYRTGDPWSCADLHRDHTVHRYLRDRYIEGPRTVARAGGSPRRRQWMKRKSDEISGCSDAESSDGDGIGLLAKVSVDSSDHSVDELRTASSSGGEEEDPIERMMMGRYFYEQEMDKIIDEVLSKMRGVKMIGFDSLCLDSSDSD